MLRSERDKWRRSRTIGMNTHVNTHLLRLAESATADVTLKGFLTGVSADMLSQMIPSSKAFATVLALEHRHRTLRRNNCHSKNLNITTTKNMKNHIKR